MQDLMIEHLSISGEYGRMEIHARCGGTLGSMASRPGDRSRDRGTGAGDRGDVLT